MTGYLCPPCEMNPGQLVCSCKGFRHIGICSHCIAVNHWSEEIDLHEIMLSLEGEKKKRSGYKSGVRPALTMEGPGKRPTAKKKLRRSSFGRGR